MPPFGREWLETGVHHGITERLAQCELLFGEVGIGRIRLFAEPIKGATHIHLPLSVHVEKRQIDSAAAAVARACANELQLKQTAFVHIGIEIFLHANIIDLFSPTNEVIDSCLRTICIEHFQSIAFRN